MNFPTFNLKYRNLAFSNNTVKGRLVTNYACMDRLGGQCDRVPVVKYSVGMYTHLQRLTSALKNIKEIFPKEKSNQSII